ncbi:MAG: hypothetical protein V4696_13365 [Pseudomonadota bacterium]
MIRPATLADIPMIMELGRRFADEAGVTEQVGWEDESVSALLEAMVANHILLVGDRAIFGALVFGHPFSGRLIFQELFWRNEGPATQGVRLLDMAERIARERGCERALMLAVATMPGAERIYERRGYRPAERTFIKDL